MPRPEHQSEKLFNLYPYQPMVLCDRFLTRHRAMNSSQRCSTVHLPAAGLTGLAMFFLLSLGEIHAKNSMSGGLLG